MADSIFPRTTRSAISVNDVKRSVGNTMMLAEEEEDIVETAVV
jgi:hypothetical protein